jgi:hypothetical protein
MTRTFADDVADGHALQKWHRHTFKLRKLSECSIDENGVVQPQEFEYCDICKQVPASLVGKG